MHEALIQYINTHTSTPLTDSDIDIIKNIFTPRRIRKRQYFLQEGDVSKYMGFIVKGAMRQYSVDDKGNEHIVRLYIENWWAGDRESFAMLTPSKYNIDAWEDTDILTITKASVVEFNTIPALNELARNLDEMHSIAFQKRINAAISMSVEQRYAELANAYPEFIQRFPQHIIASYLGVTKETLSRVRTKR
ncbi:Crp/Fnr family transcriptional regulator [Chitinophaga sp. Cy-1792]|uniref:Crp/Fnr family transcriptional regulator n=1 Tax=Chitinophaga sp. Cy-1792 TaxID=2608339 RepID=UPI001422E3DB|nr:Crp/Fnr family transcriptional regulator [Chitinophaga sp. Cy-1792]NIG54682.1 Crp/Fnr family transcriptional regulator [Chitinophaga sp. Cy-1792]